MNKKIVYILSTNFAGSHLLSLQLGSHSQCASIGELHHFRRKHTRYRACHSCVSDEKCPLFKGLKEHSSSTFYDMIFRNLADYDSAVTTVIDNSKKVRWACRFTNRPGYTRKYIHLIRDPRALVRRWMITFNEKEKRKMRLKTARRCWPHAWDILTGDEANVYVWDWLYENRQVADFIDRHKLDAKVVTYHDLVFKTDDVLSDLMEWMGLQYEPSQKEYWNYLHHSSLKENYMRPHENTEKVFDQRWKTFLSQDVQCRIFNHPYIQTFLREININFDRDYGLVNMDSIKNPKFCDL